MAKNTKAIPLVGQELLDRIQNLGDMGKREKAIACGYFSEKPDGGIKANTQKFMNAILEAQGINLGATQKTDGRGKVASFRTTVHQNGQILIGSTYTKEMNLQPGDEFEIKLGYKHIHLRQVEDEAA